MRLTENDYRTKPFDGKNPFDPGRVGVSYYDGLLQDIEESYQVSEQLNPKLWQQDGTLRPEVHDKLIEIQDQFIEELNENNIPVAVLDAWIVGSNASYNYTDQSDLDLHIIVDSNASSCDAAVLQILYNYFKSNFNSKYDISIHGIDVELYIEDVNSNAVSNGIYSLKQDKWIKKPIKADIPEVQIDSELLQKWVDKYNNVVAGVSAQTAQSLVNELYLLRKQSLATEGEYGQGNLIFKEFRNNAYLDKLKEIAAGDKSKELSLESRKLKGDVSMKNTLYEAIINNASREIRCYDRTTGEELCFNLEEGVKDGYTLFIKALAEKLNYEGDEFNSTVNLWEFCNNNTDVLEKMFENATTVRECYDSLVQFINEGVSIKEGARLAKCLSNANIITESLKEEKAPSYSTELMQKLTDLPEGSIIEIRNAEGTVDKAFRKVSTSAGIWVCTKEGTAESAYTTDLATDYKDDSWMIDYVQAEGLHRTAIKGVATKNIDTKNIKESLYSTLDLDDIDDIVSGVLNKVKRKDCVITASAEYNSDCSKITLFVRLKNGEEHTSTVSLEELDTLEQLHRSIKNKFELMTDVCEEQSHKRDKENTSRNSTTNKLAEATNEKKEVFVYKAMDINGNGVYKVFYDDGTYEILKGSRAYERSLGDYDKFVSIETLRHATAPPKSAIRQSRIGEDKSKSLKEGRITWVQGGEGFKYRNFYVDKVEGGWKIGSPDWYGITTAFGWEEYSNDGSKFNEIYSEQELVSIIDKFYDWLRSNRDRLRKKVDDVYKDYYEVSESGENDGAPHNNERKAAQKDVKRTRNVRMNKRENVSIKENISGDASRLMDVLAIAKKIGIETVQELMDFQERYKGQDLLVALKDYEKEFDAAGEELDENIFTKRKERKNLYKQISNIDDIILTGDDSTSDDKSKKADSRYKMKVREGAEQKGLYYISYKANDVYQAILAKASSEQEAKDKVQKKVPNAEILSVRVAYAGDKKPGMPVVENTLKIRESKDTKFYYDVVIFNDDAENPEANKLRYTSRLQAYSRYDDSLNEPGVEKSVLLRVLPDGCQIVTSSKDIDDDTLSDLEDLGYDVDTVVKDSLGEELFNESPDTFGIPTDDELDAEYQKKKELIAKKRVLAQSKYDSVASLKVKKMVNKKTDGFINNQAIMKGFSDLAESYGLTANRTHSNYIRFYDDNILIESEERITSDIFSPGYNICARVGLIVSRGTLKIESYITLRSVSSTRYVVDEAEEVSKELTVSELLKLIKSKVERVSKRFSEIKDLVKSSADNIAAQSKQYSYNSRDRFFQIVSSIINGHEVNDDDYEEENGEGQVVEESLNESAEYRDKTQQGWPVLKLGKSSKWGDPVAIIHRVTDKWEDYVVAWMYDVETGTWGQGHYMFDTQEEAEEYAKNEYGNNVFESVNKKQTQALKENSSKDFSVDRATKVFSYLVDKYQVDMFDDDDIMNDYVELISKYNKFTGNKLPKDIYNAFKDVPEEKVKAFWDDTLRHYALSDVLESNMSKFYAKFGKKQCAVKESKKVRRK